jgi:hypothetical protein
MADLGIKRISVEPVIAAPEDDFAFEKKICKKLKKVMISSVRKY